MALAVLCKDCGQVERMRRKLATGLEPGAHEYQIVGENSRGDDPASKPATENVAESAVA